MYGRGVKAATKSRWLSRGRAGSAAKAAHAMIDAYRPRLVVSAGFAGGLDPRVRRQDLVVATSLIGSGAGGEGSEITLDPARFLPGLDEVQNLHRGRLLTVDRVVRLPVEKHELGRQHDALAADMETFCVARPAASGQSFLAFAQSATRFTMSFRLISENWLAERSFCGLLGRGGGLDISASRGGEGSIQPASECPGVLQPLGRVSGDADPTLGVIVLITLRREAIDS